MTNDPIRLSDSEGTPDELRALLNNARSDLPSKKALAALGIALPTLALPKAAAAATALKAQTGVGAALGSSKLIAGVVFTVVAGASLYGVYGGREPIPPDSSAPGVVASAERKPTAAANEETRFEPQIDEALSEDPVPSAGGVDPSTESDPPTTRKSPPVSELTLLQRARAQLKSSPQQSLRLVEQHSRQFPGSQFTQEREVIRIEALRLLGREAEAEKRGEDFKKKFPDSALRNKLDNQSP